MSLLSLLLASTIVFYAAAFLLYLNDLFGKSVKWIRPDLIFEAGFLFHTFLIFASSEALFRQADIKTVLFYLPVATLGQSLIFFAWATAFIYVVLLRYLNQKSFGLILAPFLAALLLAAGALGNEKMMPLKYFRDSYFFIHIFSAFFAYAGFTLSAIASVLYLIQSRILKSKQFGNFFHRFPPLNELERFIYASILWGIFLLGIGILSGAFWSRSMFHTFFVREPKVIASLLTWLVYGLIFYLRQASFLRGRRSVTAALCTFGLVLFTFLGTSFIHSNLHIGI